LPQQPPYFVLRVGGPGGIAVAFKVSKLAHLVGVGIALVLGGEVASRLDDAMRLDVPFWASPTRDHDLVEAQTWGVHGRPHGRYRKWKLNKFGFRAPPMQMEPDPNRPRLFILGASETFGLYEDADREYPAVLAQHLHAKYEVVNAAMAGITLKRMVPYWEHWAGNFRAQQVLIYPSPMFYLDDKPPGLPSLVRQPEEPVFRPRLVERIRDTYHVLPDWLRAWREEWVLRRNASGQEPFLSVPPDRLEQFGADLDALIDRVQQGGAEVVLMTHASSPAQPPEPQDETFIRRMRMFYPRATAEVLVEFEARANAVIRAAARRHHLKLVDADQAMTGRRELFADMVHFNNDGAARLAELVEQTLR
jgi:lysophospholipase L1-like esterase